MPRLDEPALVRYVAAHTSATALALYDASDPDAAAAALRAAAAEICQIATLTSPTTRCPTGARSATRTGYPSCAWT